MNSYIKYRKPGYLSQRDMAKWVGCCQATFCKFVRRGQIDQPTHGDGKLKYYVKSDRNRIKHQWHNRQHIQQVRIGEMEQAHGFYTKRRAAEYLGMPHITLQYWTTAGKLPQPAHQINRCLCYRREELDHFRKHQLARYFARRAV